MKVMIFGGTSEGRKLSSALSASGVNTTLSVTTEYGKSIALCDDLDIYADTLTQERMLDLLKQGDFNYVIDATHPYAVLATQNIKSACETAGIEYFRLKRPEIGNIPGVTYVPDVQSAVETLKNSNGKALLTIGSKELEPFTHIENYAKRFFVRILPMQNSLEKVIKLGFCGSQIICMQGPFDKEMNAATLKMTGAKYLVTKNSGDAGGFTAKVSAALDLGCEVIVISRPVHEEGLRMDEILKRFDAQKPAFFPLFIDMRSKPVLVIGGGKVAERRIKSLLSFGADITVISPQSTGFIKHEMVKLIARHYQPGDIKNIAPLFVLAATNDRQANHTAMEEASSLGIPISVADSREECTCFFPALAENDDYIAGLVSKNGNHIGVKQMAIQIRELIHTWAKQSE